MISLEIIFLYEFNKLGIERHSITPKTKPELDIEASQTGSNF